MVCYHSSLLPVRNTTQPRSFGVGIKVIVVQGIGGFVQRVGRRDLCSRAYSKAEQEMATTELLLCINMQHVLPYAYLYSVTLRDKREETKDRRKETGIREDKNYIKRLCSKNASSQFRRTTFMFPRGYLWITGVECNCSCLNA